MIGIFFLFALVAGVVYFFLKQFGLVARICISAGVFVVLCALFMLIITKIGDKPPTNSIIITPEMLQDNKQP